MIRHVVLVRFRNDVQPHEIEAVFARLDALGAVLPGMLTFKAGRNVSPENLARGFGHAFTADFADDASRDAYLVHPDHRAAGANLVALTEGGVDGITVVDFEIA